MFDYVQKLQLALGDVARRTGLKAGAGLVIAIGAGFLLAALWSFLATELGWGAMLASLTIGGGFVAVGLIVLIVASRQRHPMPTGDDLKREVEARLSLAADAAADRAHLEAARIADMAGRKVQSLMDDAGYRASKLADDAERRVQGFVRDSADSIGLTDENIRAARKGARQAADSASRAANTNAGSMAKLLGAFAVGVAIAAKLREGRRADADRDQGDGTA